MILSRTLLVAAGLLFLCACGDGAGSGDADAGDTGGDGSDGIDHPAAANAFCDELLAVACAEQILCHNLDEDTCLTEFAGADVARMCSAGIAAVEAGVSSVNTSRASACLTAIGEATCDRRGTFLVEPCDEVFVAEATPETDCVREQHYYVAQCAGGFCRAHTEDPCRSVCTAFTEVGDACDPSDPSVRCDSNGAFCNEDGVCQVFPEVGEPCPGGRCSGAERQLCSVVEGYAERVCVQSWVPQGSACDELNTCRVGYFCVGGVCQNDVAAGDQCAYDDNCPDGLRCLIGSNEENIPTCQAEPAIGELCFWADQRPCGDAGVCTPIDFEGTEYRCSATAGLGEECPDTTVQCAEGLWCGPIAGDETFVSRCHELGDVGDPCSAYEYSFYGSCNDGLFCYRGACAAPAGAGTACPHNQPEILCNAGTSCGVDGTCVAPATDGEACNARAYGLGCEGTSWCDCGAGCDPFGGDIAETVPGTCAEAYAPGSTCEGDWQCGGGYCEEGRCVRGEEPIECE